MFSRRAFVLGSTVGLLAPRLGAQAARLTAQEVIDRVKVALGPPKAGNTVDGFRAGDPATTVTGVATTVMATVPMLKRAVAAKANLVITLEPVFYSANDDPGTRGTDPVYLTKKKLIEDEKLVVYRLADLWTVQNPDTFTGPLARFLGGTPVAGAEHVYDIPEKPLSGLRLNPGLPGTRIVGDPNLRVRRVLISPGTTTLTGVMAGLRVADAVLAGEPREWEAVPYVLDAVTAGERKGMVMLGRVISQDPGMNECATWLKARVPEVPVTHLYTTDFYWKASAPPPARQDL